MKVLVLNCGSSSFKYQLLDMETRRIYCSGLVERIGSAMGKLVHKVYPDTDKEKKHTFEQPFPTHTVGMEAIMALLTDVEMGVIASLEEINAVGHRVVQGGEKLQKACLVGAAERKAIAELAPLAPLHNPANLQGIEVAQKLLPHAPSVAVFDTEFHATMPAKAYIYPIPYELYTELQVRRYGFHGTSHSYVTKEAARIVNKPVGAINIITCHLGNGCSITAVENGKSVDTSMGMTPLAGVMMGTRSGDIDPAICAYLGKHKGLSSEEVENILNKQSGLSGICGLNDMRDIHDAVAKGDAKAKLALDMLCYSIRKYVGAYYAVLGRVDAVVFTAGIGENDDIVRLAVCSGLDNLGIAIDEAKNSVRSSEGRIISPEGTRVPVMVIPTNEELAIAQATVAVLGK